MNQLDQGIRQGHVIQFLGGLATVLVGPVEELQHFVALLGLVLHLVHQDEGGAGDRPGILARLVGQDFAERGLAPVGACGSGLEGDVVRDHEIAGDVLQNRVSHLVLLGVGIFHIANRTGQTLDEGGHALVALAAETNRPLRRGAGTDLGLPLVIDLGQVVGEDEGGAGTIGATDHADVGSGQRQLGIQVGNRFVIPLGDLAQIDVGQHGAGQLQLTRLDAGQIDHRHNPADHRGELLQAVLFQVFDRKRHVGSTEIHGLGGDLLDPAAGADRLVVDLVAGGFLVGVGPLGINRGGEAGAGARHFGSLGRGGQGNDGCGEEILKFCAHLQFLHEGLRLVVNGPLGAV